MVFDLPPPAIIQRAEPWELELHRKLSPLGIPRNIRRAIIAEFKKLEGAPRGILKPAFADLARYGKDPALASLLVPPIGWSGAVSVTAFNISHTATNQVFNDASSYTFSGQAIGANDASRYVLVAAGGRASADAAVTIDGITVGGNSGSAVVTNINTNVGGRASIWKIAISAAVTTADIIVTFSGTVQHCGIQVWRMVGANAAETGSASDIIIASNTILDGSLTIPAGGGGIGYAKAHGSAAERTWAWTNLTEETSSDIGIGESNHSHSAASSMTAGAATRTATASSTIDGGVLLLAAWGP